MTREAATPPRPDPWATTAPREALRDTNAARINSLTPGASTMMVGDEAVPCFDNMVDFCGHDEDYSPDVRFTGQRAMTLRSKTQHVHGGGHGGKCEPIEHARQVRVNGAYLPCDGDRFYMDDRCTVGEAQFMRDTACYPAPVDTDPLAGSTRSSSTQQASSFGPWAQQIGLDGKPVATDAPPNPVLPGRQYALSGPGGFPPAVTTAPLVVPQAPTVGPNIDGTPSAPSGGGPGSFFQTYRPLNNPAYGPAYYTDLPGPLSYVEPQFGGWFQLRDGSLVRREQLEEMYQAAKRKRDEESDHQQEFLDQVFPDQAARRQRDLDALLRRMPGGNARISPKATNDNEPQDKCKIGPYREMEKYCKTYGMQAHHIVPDYTLRYGDRDESMRDEKRIPNSNLPDYWSAPSICLSGSAFVKRTEHWQAHLADKTVEQHGQKLGTPLGTAPFMDVRDAAVDSVLSVRRECTKEVAEAVEKNFGKVSPYLLVRTTTPTTREALGPLSRGDLATIH